MRALIIREPWITWILDGKKTWEIRGSATSVRGKIGLIRAQSGLIVGTAELVACEGPLDLAELHRFRRKHCVEPAHFRDVLERYARPHAWVLAKARRLRRPIRYKHPSGAVIWVNAPGRGS